MPNERLPRPAVEMNGPFVRAVKVKARERGTSASHLWHHWVLTADALARAGQGHLLPQQKRAPRGSVGSDTAIARWPQGGEDYAACRAGIEAAGSSVPAVLREAGAAYLAADGDVRAMRWPSKRALRAAAA